MMIDDTDYTIILFTAMALAASVSVFICISFMVYGLVAVPSRLLFYFHVTLLLTVLTEAPYIYGQNGSNSFLCKLCSTVAFWSVLCNVLIVFLMTVYYRSLFKYNMWYKWILKYFQTKNYLLEMVVFVFPMVFVAPWVDEYQMMSEEWCHNLVFGVHVTVIVWSSFFNLLSIGLVIDTIFFVYKSDKHTAKTLVSTIFLYDVTAILTWPFRVLFYGLDPSYTALLIDGSSMVYFSIYMREKKALILFEIFASENAPQRSLHSPNERETFSWDTTDSWLSEEVDSGVFASDVPTESLHSSSLPSAASRPNSCEDTSGSGSLSKSFSGPARSSESVRSSWNPTRTSSSTRVIGGFSAGAIVEDSDNGIGNPLL